MKLIIIVAALTFASMTAAAPGVSNEKRLIQTDSDTVAWLNQAEIENLIASGVNFMDITGKTFPPYGEQNAAAAVNAIPSAIRFPDIVRAALPAVNVPRLASFVTSFSNDFNNRYYTSATGLSAQVWLLEQVQGIIASSNYPGNASVSTFTHSGYAQKSIIARIQGSDATLAREVLIFGGHLDSVNSISPVNGRAPGADDNASGSATLLEGLRVFLASQVVPRRSLEFQWYAAEEVGLRGSGDIAASYFQQGVPVVGMVNYDVVGYDAAPNAISFLSDFTHLEFTNFLKLVVDEYCGVGWVNYRCGYGCSDHASWNRYNFPAASPNENPLSPYMHGTSDTIGTVNFDMVAEFVKLTVAAAIEITEPSSA